MTKTWPFIAYFDVYFKSVFTVADLFYHLKLFTVLSAQLTDPNFCGEEVNTSSKTQQQFSKEWFDRLIIISWEPRC